MIPIPDFFIIYLQSLGGKETRQLLRWIEFGASPESEMEHYLLSGLPKPSNEELDKFAAAVRGTGTKEDALAKLHGLVRMPGESDIELQARIQKAKNYA
jgi:hypothetical protein